ncbi:MAG TPA: sigma-70 family RNA polymerase sigma factor [Gaiellales bacterium]|jgi:RNA polymerase sigma-B factor|nr:sigma-70 family RNA polymerase sigma factor [Gaiellales bacterium]
MSVDDALGPVAVRASAGDPEARTALVEQIRPLVASLAGRFEGRAARDDLEQSGMVGVLAALRGFDPGHGASFEAYATPFIIGEMLDTARQTAPVRVSRTARELAAAVEAAAEEAAAEAGRSPTVAEIAAAADTDEEHVIAGLAARRALATPVSDDRLLEEFGGREDVIEAAETRLDVANLLRALDRRSQAILALRFGLDLSQEEIASRLGISQMHVSRLLRAALDELDERIG